MLNFTKPILVENGLTCVTWPHWSNEKDEYLFISEHSESRENYGRLARLPLTIPMIFRIVRSSAQKRKTL